MISHSKPTLDQDDYREVLDVLRSGHLVQGEKVAVFEKELSTFIGAKSGVAVSSGTAALHLSLIALGVGEEDEVIFPSYVCSALLNAVLYVGAFPVFADIDAATFNINIADLKRKITKKTKTIIVPHMFGLPADIDEIVSLGIPVIEDCAQSLGSKYKGSYTGRFGILSMFSFYATKMLSTGEGGMVLSDNEALISTIKDLRDYDEKENYSARYNYKMTDLQAALGISQLKKLPSFIERRKKIAGLYNETLKKMTFPIPQVAEEREHVYYRYVVLDRKHPSFMEAMRERGIDCRRPVFKPLHNYLDLSGFPVTDEIFRQAVSIPIYPSLTDEEVSEIVDAMKSLL